ncbi:hypothetical protein [Methanococcoides sp. AM1]|uniref:hypothetical protein n=1 Tax=Methanococcoides sp. AM1 TaxID=1201011 RepID=UPI0010838016|nr:hypothetical protein [Methanococcoides sp. AM1]
MVVRQTLKTREFGYELSGFEHNLIFEKDEIGFVRFDGRSRSIFYLDPSPFFQSPKREIYAIRDSDVPLPSKNELIEVTSFELERVVSGKMNNLVNTNVKYVRSWEKIDPNKLLHRKVMNSEEYVDFFKRPFKKEAENIDEIAQTLALCSVSSNAVGINEKGGIDSGIISKKSGWEHFKSIMRIIPKEFKSTKSAYYYNSLEVEKNVNSIDSLEVNLSIFNPKEMFVHVPVTFDIDTRRRDEYLKDISFEIPFARAQLIDSLMFQPVITKKAEKRLTDRIYDMIETFTHADKLSYKQDLGDAGPKIASSIARMNFKTEVSVDDVDNGYYNWLDMFHHSQQFRDSNLETNEIFRLSENARNLYLEMEQYFGVDTIIDIADIEKITHLSPKALSDAISKLVSVGAAYSPRQKTIKLLSFRI